MVGRFNEGEEGCDAGVLEVFEDGDLTVEVEADFGCEAGDGDGFYGDVGGYCGVGGLAAEVDGGEGAGAELGD